MKAIPQVDLNGFYIEDCVVGMEVEGVQEVYESLPSSIPIDENTDGNEESKETIIPKIIGYLIAIPLTSTFYKPKFKIQSWFDYLKLDEDAQKEINLSDFWVEGLTDDEIEEINKPPIIIPTPLEVEVKSLRDQLNSTKEELSGTQMALAETYEQMMKAESESASALVALTELYEYVMSMENNAALENEQTQ